MKKVVFSLLSMVLASSVAVAAAAKDNETNSSVITPTAIFYEYEPNNTFSQASPFQAINGNQINAALSPDGSDDDFFVFTAPKSGNFQFSIAYNPRNKLRFELFDRNADIDYPLNFVRDGEYSFTHYLTKGEKYYLLVTGARYYNGEEIPYSVYVNN